MVIVNNSNKNHKYLILVNDNENIICEFEF